MKRFLMYSLVALLGMATLSCSREDGADGINGINGIDGINGKTILSGKGEPSTSLGTIGDFYLNLDNYNLYGPKSEQGWGNPISLIGAKGDKGEDGKDGADGQNGADGKDGKDGRDGKDGADGRDGVDGKDAPKIWTGETAPTSSIGNEGDFYLDLKNKVLYGPKTNGSWGEGIVLGGGSSSLKGNYVLSADGTILLQWFNKDMTNIDMEADVDLKNVKRIARMAFDTGDLQEIILPSGLKSIADSAFRFNELKAIVIPNQVTEIGNGAFRGNKLESVSIPNSVTYIGKGAFRDNELTSVTIPSSVTSIGDGAFMGNRYYYIYGYSNKITSLVLSNGIKIIGQEAFRHNQLTSVTIPSSVTSIGGGAFRDNSLTQVRVNATTPPSLGYYAFGYVSDIIYVPKGSGDAYRNHKDWERYKDLIVEQ